MIIIHVINHNLTMVKYYHISKFAKIATSAQFITLINTFTFELDHTQFIANRYIIASVCPMYDYTGIETTKLDKRDQ